MNSKKFKLFFLPAISLAIISCGESIPTDKDVNAALVKDLGDCPYIKIVSAKKTNGAEGDKKNEYIVDESFSVAFNPTSSQIEILDQYYELLEVSKNNKNKTIEIYEKMQLLDKEQLEKIRGLQPFSYKVRDEIYAEYEPVLEGLSKEREEIAKSFGFPDSINFENPGEFLTRKYVAQAQSEFLNSCINKMTPDGRQIVEKVFEGEKISTTIYKGRSVDLTRRQVYIKTEKGWEALKNR